MILLFLSLLNISIASELSCLAHFPIKESVNIVKRLVAKYAIPVTRKDENGIEWINNLIVKNKGLEIDGTRYFLNDNRLPPEMTFYFGDSLILDSVPIFVVDEDQLEKWRPDFPDRTYSLTKISHQCSVGQRACGLKCCYNEMDKIQKGFLETGAGGNLTNSMTFVYNDVIYSLNSKHNSSSVRCSYALSYHDLLFRQANMDGKPVSTIHFFCPETFSCCGLTCLPSPESALLRKPRKAESFSVKLHRQKNVLLIAGALLAFTAFVGVTYINYRTTSLYSSRSSLDSTYSRNRVSRQTVDTQTSTSSLHAYVDSRAPLTNIHAV